ncbi:glycoside hydrolase family 125 protein [Gorillibacterium sp. CAU 1737]|uniref:glycoside hydrolase family 125 protein n=1 Tax=Gorillibacterium sp. CAU 1737 TaxID=3140362 RepID=UPI0032616CD9
MVSRIKEALKDEPKLARMFENCFTNTILTTIKEKEDGTTFVITGDIPAMWLRDSAAQVRPYLVLAEEDEGIAKMIAGLVEQQMTFVLKDPYANAFNEEANGKGHQEDRTAMNPWIWERKYEIDSLAYPIQLGYLLWKNSGCVKHFNETFRQAAYEIIKLWKVEQHHEDKSPYTFQRLNAPETDTLVREGKGSETAYTGMTWSGFRPSDDCCEYGYLIPSNMFAVVALRYLDEIARTVYEDSKLAEEALSLASEIEAGIRQHGTYNHPIYGELYAYETDGKGSYNLMDDANVPSLLSLPYLGYTDEQDPIYQNTRRFILSEANPFFFRGQAAEGIGSPHTPSGYIWHIALSMQGLTSPDREEKSRMLRLIEQTDADTDLTHESFSAEDPHAFTRPWFSWSNMLFSELIMDYCGIRIRK